MPNLLLPSLNRGAKVDLHLYLYEKELERLDELCTVNKCSRGALFGALIDEKYESLDLTGKVPEAGRKGARSRRR